MRVRYAMVDVARYQAECDLTEKNAREFYNKLKNDNHCVWAELVSEDDNSYMDVIDGFDHRDAHRLYKAEMEVKSIMERFFS